jgi:hypothetical protein
LTFSRPSHIYRSLAPRSTPSCPSAPPPDDISNDRYAPRAFNHACVGLSGTFGNCSPGASFVGSPPRTRDKFVVDFESVKYRPYTLGMADQHDADAVIKGSDHGWLSPTKSGY